MKCILCCHLDLQSNLKMAKLGFGRCTIDKENSHSVSFRFERDCKDYREAAEDVKEKRITWSDGILKAREMQR